MAVVSLETAIRLKEAGIVIDSALFYDNENSQLCVVEKHEQYLTGIYLNGNVIARSLHAVFYPAPDAEELKSWLASQGRLVKQEMSETYYLICIPTRDGWDVYYLARYGVIAGGVGEIISSETLCEALALVALERWAPVEIDRSAPAEYVTITSSSAEIE